MLGGASKRAYPARAAQRPLGIVPESLLSFHATGDRTILPIRDRDLKTRWHPGTRGEAVQDDLYRL